MNKAIKISKINRIKQPSMRYDITVDDYHCYVANDIVVHNTDGQNIMISWKNGKLIAARNKGNIKDRGALALDKDSINIKFDGRGAIQDAFTFAIIDLEKAMRKLSEKERQDMFGEGANFMSLEIIYPATQNVIPYGLSLLVFHELKEYDEAGNVIGTNRAAGNKLAKMIADVNADVQDHFTIGEMKKVKLVKSQNFDEHKDYYFKKLNKLQSEFNLKGSDEIAKYHQAWWERFISKKANELKYPIPNQVLMSLIKRWAFFEKKPTIVQIKKMIDNDAFKDWISKFDKDSKGHKAVWKKTMWPFEHLFLELGTEIMTNMKNFMAANPDEAVQKIKANLEKKIVQVKNSKDIKSIKTLEADLKKIQSLGGFKKIMPTEGITFHYKGKLYKLTGLFAEINKIMGMMKYGR